MFKCSNGTINVLFMATMCHMVLCRWCMRTTKLSTINIIALEYISSSFRLEKINNDRIRSKTVPDFPLNISGVRVKWSANEICKVNSNVKMLRNYNFIRVTFQIKYQYFHQAIVLNPIHSTTFLLYKVCKNNVNLKHFI